MLRAVLIVLLTLAAMATAAAQDLEPEATPEVTPEVPTEPTAAADLDLVAPTPTPQEPGPLPIFTRVIGAETLYKVQAGDTLGAIAARYGMRIRVATAVNGLTDANKLHLGQQLWLSNLRIVPDDLQDGIVINVADLTLYRIRGGEPSGQFPVGVGRTAWRTPSGMYTITGRRRDPIWYVPPSIQREMRNQGREVKKKVDPGPDNPLGQYWLQLSVPGYGIHGTNVPTSVGRYTTHGCIRMLADDIEKLYNELPTGTSVHVVDEAVKLARLEDGRILLEVHAGLDNVRVSGSHLMRHIEASGLGDVVDREKVDKVAQDAWGIAVNVSR